MGRPGSENVRRATGWLAGEPGRPCAKKAHGRAQAHRAAVLHKRWGKAPRSRRELHPEKTKVVYCKDGNRTGEYPVTTFDFLGYTFRARRSTTWQGRYFVNFSPAVSGKAAKAIRREVRGMEAAASQRPVPG